MSYTQLGLFTGLYGLLAMLLSVPAGISAKRFGEKHVLGIGLLGVAAGSVLLGEASNFGSAIAFRGLTIFGYRFAFVSVLIAIALTAPPSLRGRTMGVLGATSALASVVGAPLGGCSSSRSAGASPSSATQRWRWSAQQCSGCFIGRRPMTRGAPACRQRTAAAAGAPFARPSCG